jgi:hypothetical protein
MDIGFADDFNISCIVRKSETLIPRGSTEIRAGDVLIIVTKAERTKPFSRHSPDRSGMKTMPSERSESYRALIGHLGFSIMCVGCIMIIPWPSSSLSLGTIGITQLHHTQRRVAYRRVYAFPRRPREEGDP